MSSERLFFALLPDDAACMALSDAAAGLASAHAGLRRVRPERWHMTVLFLGQHAGPDRRCIGAALQAGSALDLRGGCILLDRTLALGHARRPAIALAARSIPDWLTRLRQALRAALMEPCARLDGERTFQPHITLAYASEACATPAAAAPVTLTPAQLVLLRSVSGETDYRRLAAWPLRH